MASTDHAQIAAAQREEDISTGELIARYRSGSDLLRDAVAGLTREQLLAHPIPGTMSAQEVVCHVADCDQFLADRMKRTIAMDRPLLMGADGWLYPDRLHYGKRAVELDLELIRVTRSQMAHDLDGLDSEAWARVAVHSETGLVTVRQLLLHAIRHLDWHIGTILEKRAAMTAGQ